MQEEKPMFKSIYTPTKGVLYDNATQWAAKTGRKPFEVTLRKFKPTDMYQLYIDDSRFTSPHASISITDVDTGEIFNFGIGGSLDNHGQDLDGSLAIRSPDPQINRIIDIADKFKLKPLSETDTNTSGELGEERAILLNNLLSKFTSGGMIGRSYYAKIQDETTWGLYDYGLLSNNCITTLSLIFPFLFDYLHPIQKFILKKFASTSLAPLTRSGGKKKRKKRTYKRKRIVLK